ncbi:MAG TPA: precorrin-8X methylmutase [Stellaceae bacterium]|nr:precorrin-8X methylmutase [Stellaceae bacterium]
MSEATHYTYLRDGDAIRRRSFALIAATPELTRLAPDLRPLAIRIAHAAGDTGILADLVSSPAAVAAGRAALAAGAPVFADAQMVAAGITKSANRIIATIADAEVPSLAQKLGTTRAAAAVELWRPMLAGAVCAIGNAPTSLFHLLELVRDGAPKPALVLGFPVGFVGAAEAKAALAENPFGLPYVALLGRRGGSAIAAAAVNALLAGDAA